jgi:hypothetical protein
MLVLFGDRSQETGGRRLVEASLLPASNSITPDF